MKLKFTLIALVAMLSSFAVNAANSQQVDVVLPTGVSESTFGANTVTDGTNYYATLQAATEAVVGNADAVLYCKPSADVGSLQHAPVTATLTVYGNGARVTGGSERDFDFGNTDPSGGKDITADMTLTVKNLDGCGAWGTKATEHTVNLVFEGCGNMGKVLAYGTTGTLNITMNNCAFEGVLKEAIYSNADGAITLNNVAFSNLNKAINLNHKAAGTQTVTISGCSFTNCGNDVAIDQIPVRVLTSVEGGKSVLNVSNTTFTGTPEGGADILLDYGVGVTEATVSNTAANVLPENKDGNAEMVSVTANQGYTNVAPTDVKVATLAELQAALADDSNESPIVVTAQIVIPQGETVVLDLNGKTVNSVFNGTSTTNHIYALSNKGTLTIQGNGSINSRGIYNYGSLTLNAGAINAIDGNGGYAVNNQNGSTFVMNGGVVAATNEDDHQSSSGGYDATALKVPAGCTATLNGGTINNVCDFTFAIDAAGTLNIPATSTIIVNGTHGAIAVSGGTTTIDAGTFQIPADEYSRTDNVLYVIGGSLVVNGGTFIGDSDTAAGGSCLCDEAGKAVVNGGTFKGSSGGDVWGTTGTTIKGGTFENLTEKQHIADGYELGEDGKVISSIAYVAKIGETKYETLEDAVAAAQNNETITLIDNVVLAEVVTIPAGKTLTIDLNGKAISMEESIIATAYAINNLGNLTIKDGVGGGSINARGIYNGYGNGGANVASAKITVLSGTINAKGTNGGGAAIFNYGVADIQGGTFTSVASYAIALQTGSTMTIGENAIITGGINSWQSTLTITGGTISNDKSGKHVVYAGESTVAINGGTFHNNNSGNATIMASGTTAAVEITGGTFTLNIVNAASSYLIDATSSATYTISGGSFTGGIRAQGGTKYEITGGTFTNEYGNYNVYEGGDINISGGTFTGSYAQEFATDNLAAGYELSADGKVISTVAVLEGEGTETSPYLIKNVNDLVLFRNSVNAGETKYNAEGVYVALGADIDLAGIDWSVNIGDDCAVTFDGIFDGKGYTISNLTATETATKADGYICTGLFGAIYGNAVVKNLTIENVTIDAQYAGNNVSAVVGFAYNATGSIENVKVIGDININAPLATGVGAIVGYDYYSPALTVKNSVVKGNDGSAIVGKSYTGGLVGYASSKIAMNNNTVENISITATGSVAGVAGIMLGGSSATGNTVKNVTVKAEGELWANSAAVVAGTITGGSVTVSGTTVENVTANGAEASIVGGILVEKPTTAIVKVQAQIGDVYYTTFANAYADAQAGETIVLIADTEVVEDETITLNGVNLSTLNGVTLTNNSTIEVKGEVSLNIATLAGSSIDFLDGAIVKNSTIGGNVFVAGNVTFRGANTFAMLSDFGTLTDYYGTTAPMKWTVEEGASVTLTNAARYGLGYGDDVTVYGNIEDALTARENLTDADRSLFMHGLVAQESKGWNCDSKFTVENAYVAIGSNNSFGNKSGNYGGTYTFNIKNSVVDASRITFYEALSTTTFTFDGCDVKMGTFMTRDADSKFTLKNSKVLSTTASNGTDEGNYNKGELTLENSTLTYSAPLKHEAGVINLDGNSVLTAPSISGAGTIEIDATALTEAKTVIVADMSSFTGAINVKGGCYTITSEGVVVERGLTGEGTEANPYLINNVDDLVFFRNSVNAGETQYNAEGVYVALGANIDLTGIDWSVNIGDDCAVTFDGIFDGKGFTISNLTATETAKKGDGYICTGLFGAIYGNAVVKNLTIENVTINAPFVGNNVAAVVGFAYACKGSIEDVKVVGVNINAPEATGVGAIVGYDYYSPALTVKNCVVKGNDGSAIVGKSYTGGLVGYASSKIAMNNNTIEDVTVSATASVGAVAGIMLGGGSATDNTVKNVTLTANGALWANSSAVVAGTITGGAVTVSNTNVENVTANGAEARIVGGILVEKPTTAIAKVQAQIGDVYYTTFAKAVAAAQADETITLIADAEVAADEEITLNGLDVDAENVTLTINGTVNVDLNSTLSITTVVGNGTINVDATGVMEEVVVVAGDMSGFAGAINVTGGDCEIRNEGLVAYNASYISEYTIDDANSVDFTNDAEKTVGTLTYKRTLAENVWNPLYLPFEISVEELVENYDIAYYNQMHSYDSDNNGSFDSYEMEVAYITTGTLRANYPYFIRPKSAEACALEYVAEDVTLYRAYEKKIVTSSVANIFTLSGTHKAMSVSDLEGCYAISADGWAPSTSGIKAHRLYLKIEENDNSPFATTRAKSIRIVVAGEGTTGVEGVKTENAEVEAIYDLSGRRVLEAEKGGIYIVNGVKTLVK